MRCKKSLCNLLTVKRRFSACSLKFGVLDKYLPAMAKTYLRGFNNTQQKALKKQLAVLAKVVEQKQAWLNDTCDIYAYSKTCVARNNKQFEKVLYAVNTITNFLT